MSMPSRRASNWTATVFGAGVFTALMTGVGGYQLWNAHLAAVAKERPAVRAVHSPVGSALSMCPGWPASGGAGDASSSLTVQVGLGSDAADRWTGHSALGLASVCD